MKPKYLILAIFLSLPLQCLAAISARTLTVPSAATKTLTPAAIEQITTATTSAPTTSTSNPTSGERINTGVTGGKSTSATQPSVINPDIKNISGTVNQGGAASALQSSKTNTAEPAAANTKLVKSIQIIEPKSSDSFAMDGTSMQTYFKFFGIDSSKQGKLKYKVELLHNGVVLGMASKDEWNLDVAKGYDELSFTRGWYYTPEKKEAEPGDGYAVKISIMEGSSVIMSNISEEFSLSSQGALPALALKVMSPNGGEEYAKDGDVISTWYTYAGLNPDTTGGTYTSRFELWRNGAKLGNLSNTSYTINPYQPNSNFGFQSGKYYLDDYEEKMAESGGGYQFKVIFYEKDKEIISDMSDGTFSFKDGPAFDETPEAKVLKPNGGEKFIIGDYSNCMQFSIKGFSPYLGGKINYKLFLYKGGNKLGIVTPEWLMHTVNTYKELEDYCDDFQKYYDTNEKKYVDITPGSDYQIGIEVYNIDKLVVADKSDGNFSIIKQGKVVSMINGMFKNNVNIQAPDDIKSLLANVAGQDKNIKKIAASDKEVEVKYAVKSKLLGFIPIHETITITKKTDDKTANFKKPWWSFLAKDETKNLETKLAEENNDAKNMVNAGELTKYGLENKQNFLNQIFSIVYNK